MRKIEKNYPAKCVVPGEVIVQDARGESKRGRNLGPKLPLSAMKSGSVGEGDQRIQR